MPDEVNHDATLCTATCILPGCTVPIRYLDTDASRPLFCPRHLVGREHRGYKDMRVEHLKQKPVISMFRCPRDQCARTSTEEYLKCPICGTDMVKHGEVKSPSVQEVAREVQR